MSDIQYDSDMHRSIQTSGANDDNAILSDNDSIDYLTASETSSSQDRGPYSSGSDNPNKYLSSNQSEIDQQCNTDHSSAQSMEVGATNIEGLKNEIESQSQSNLNDSPKNMKQLLEAIANML